MSPLLSFLSFQLLTVNGHYKSCLRLDLNLGPLGLYAIGLVTVTQLFPKPIFL